MKNNLNQNPFSKKKYIDQEAYEWTREQSARNVKENFVYLTVGITAFAVYATWAWLIIQKFRA